jgi:hypothetical protein
MHLRRCNGKNIAHLAIFGHDHVATPLPRPAVFDLTIIPITSTPLWPCPPLSTLPKLFVCHNLVVVYSISPSLTTLLFPSRTRHSDLATCRWRLSRLAWILPPRPHHHPCCPDLTLSPAPTQWLHLLLSAATKLSPHHPGTSLVALLVFSPSAQTHHGWARIARQSA